MAVSGAHSLNRHVLQRLCVSLWNPHANWTTTCAVGTNISILQDEESKVPFCQEGWAQILQEEPQLPCSIPWSISRTKGPAFSCLTVRGKGVGYPGRMQISAKRSFENKTYSCLPRISWMWAWVKTGEPSRWPFFFPGQYWFNFGVYFCNNSSGQRNYISFHHFCLKFNDPGYLHFNLYFCFFYLLTHTEARSK